MRYMPTIRSGRPTSRQLLARFDEFFSKFERAYFDRQRAIAEREYEALSPFVPEVDIEEAEHVYLVSVDLPGLKSNEVRVDLEGQNLKISGERRRRNHEDDASYYERAHGKILRKFTIPDNIDTNRIVAQFEDGVLKILLPKLNIGEAYVERSL